MAFTVRLYINFSKRLNSTKQPAGNATYIDTSCELKAPTSIYSPVLVFDSVVEDNNFSITTCTYARIDQFNRYYFINGWTYSNGRWVAALECDTLATYKNEIGSASAYVLRSASKCNTNIIDGKYQTIANADRAYTMGFARDSTPWQTDLSASSVTITTGCYRVAITNNDTGAIGAICYYLFSPAAMREFMNKLYASPNWMNITDSSISTDLQKIMMNPVEYITDILWIPMSLSNAGMTAVTTIPVGWWSVTLTNNVYKFSSADAQAEFYKRFSLPIHPQQSDNYHDWLSLSPFTRYVLEFQPFGMFELDSQKLYGGYGIEIQVYVDLISGTGLCTVFRTDMVNGSIVRSDVPIYTVSSQVAIPISVAQMSVDLSALSSETTWIAATALGWANGDLKGHLSDFGRNLGQLGAAATQQIASAIGMSDPYPLRTAMGGALQKIGREMGVDVGEPASVGAATTQLLGSVQDIASDILPAAIASAGVCEMHGTNGGLAFLRRDIKFIYFWQNIVEQDPTHYGRPLCSIETISNLSGFVMCANEGSLDMVAPQFERQAVVAFMTGGFYYE